MSKDIEKDIRCSFCGKTQDEVTRLVEGPGVYICDGCIDFCASLLFDDENAYKEKKKGKKQPEKVLPKPQEIKAKLDEKNVVLFGDEIAREICPDIEIATDDDYYREYLDYKMSVKIVSSLDDAIEHIRKYSSGHSESIITNNTDNAEKFLNSVDSSSVYHNASTRFTDGGEFGFGAEIGISTQKLHARGPLGLPQLNSFKYKIYGNGQIR